MANFNYPTAADSMGAYPDFCSSPHAVARVHFEPFTAQIAQSFSEFNQWELPSHYLLQVEHASCCRDNSDVDYKPLRCELCKFSTEVHHPPNLAGQVHKLSGN